jgi:site-specific DNA recombinase
METGTIHFYRGAIRIAQLIQTRGLSVIERQKIVRLLVKEILVGEHTITIRHSIPIPSGPPQNGGSKALNGQNYLLCKGRDFANAQ